MTPAVAASAKIAICLKNFSIFENPYKPNIANNMPLATKLIYKGIFAFILREIAGVLAQYGCHRTRMLSRSPDSFFNRLVSLLKKVERLNCISHGQMRILHAK